MREDKEVLTPGQAKNKKLGDMAAQLGEISDDYLIIAKFRDDDGKVLWRAFSDDVWAVGAMARLTEDLMGHR